MSRPRLALVPLLAALAFAGCSMERHLIAQPGTSQAIRVESGDRFYMDLPEGEPDGARWSATCADPDVEVKIAHAPGAAEVEIRIHRGYDGPSSVAFRYRRPGTKTPLKTFTVALFKRTGDCAFWE